VGCLLSLIQFPFRDLTRQSDISKNVDYANGITIIRAIMDLEPKIRTAEENLTYYLKKQLFLFAQLKWDHLISRLCDTQFLAISFK